MTGTVLITTALIIMFHSVKVLPWRRAIPKGSVLIFGERVTTRGRTKSFQAKLNFMIASEAIAGTQSGIIILNTIRISLAPSILDESIASLARSDCSLWKVKRKGIAVIAGMQRGEERARQKRRKRNRGAADF